MGGKAERGGSISQGVALLAALTIAGVTLAAEGPTSVSWVPYQMGCPRSVDRSLSSRTQHWQSDVARRSLVGGESAILIHS